MYMWTYIVISTAQTDLGLRSRPFCLKINKLATFLKSIKAWQCLKIVGQMSSHTEFHIHTCSKPYI